MRLVICRGYKDCEDRINCTHSKPHIINTAEDECFTTKKYDEDDCDCINFSIIRKQKLEKILFKDNCLLINEKT